MLQCVVELQCCRIAVLQSRNVLQNATFARLIAPSIGLLLSCIVLFCVSFLSITQHDSRLLGLPINDIQNSIQFHIILSYSSCCIVFYFLLLIT